MFDLNKPKTWASADVHRPPDFNVPAFQKRINKIIGLAPNGLPLVRLVWAGDIKNTYSKFYTSWTNAGLGINSELRAKYKFCTIAIPDTPDIVDIPPPRWILEDWESPARYADAWEAARFSKDGREMRPPHPTTGYYAHLMTIALHDKQCCKGAQKSKVVCWGKYREPDEKDLETLKRAKFLRDKDEEIPLDKPLSEKVLASAARQTNARIAAREKLVDEKVAEFVEENALELIEMFTGQPLSEKTKKFSLPAHFKKKENGLITAN